MEHSEWETDVRTFVAEWIPAAPAHILEVGCGEGELARHTASLGYDVVAIDPRAPAGPIFRQVPLEEFSEPGPFDACVAVLSLHHISDVGDAVDKIARLIPGGRLIAVEFAWDNIDERTAQWILEHLEPGDDEGWIHRRRAEWRDSGGGSFADYLHHWATAEGLHTGPALRAAFADRFEERFFAWTPYVYPDLAGVTAEEEAALISAGTIAPVGFRFVGSPRR